MPDYLVIACLDHSVLACLISAGDRLIAADACLNFFFFFFFFFFFAGDCLIAAGACLILAAYRFFFACITGLLLHVLPALSG